MSKDDDSWGGLIIFIIVIAIFGAALNPDKSPPAAEPNAQTWQQYSQSPTEGDVTAQLANTQNLLIALNNDVSRLQAQNVDIQTALAVVNAQLIQAQKDAQEESRRQNIMAWVTTVVGAFIGFMIEKVWKWAKQFFHNDTKKPNTKDKETSHSQSNINTPLPSKPSATSQPLQQNLNASSVVRCPKCGKFMVTRSAIGKRIYACIDTQCGHEISME